MRRGQPIEGAALKDAVDPQISYSMSFAEWEAAIAAGATLGELLEWDRGDEFPLQFKEKVLAWHMAHRQIAVHSSDAVNRARK